MDTGEIVVISSKYTGGIFNNPKGDEVDRKTAVSGGS